MDTIQDRKLSADNIQVVIDELRAVTEVNDKYIANCNVGFPNSVLKDLESYNAVIKVVCARHVTYYMKQLESSQYKEIDYDILSAIHSTFVNKYNEGIKHITKTVNTYRNPGEHEFSASTLSAARRAAVEGPAVTVPNVIFSTQSGIPVNAAVERLDEVAREQANNNPH